MKEYEHLPQRDDEDEYDGLLEGRFPVDNMSICSLITS
jgi:hypothetical protein